jgi:hypothetical protein
MEDRDADRRLTRRQTLGIAQAGGSRAEVSLAGSAGAGYVGRIVVGVNPKRTPAAA